MPVIYYHCNLLFGLLYFYPILLKFPELHYPASILSNNSLWTLYKCQLLIVCSVQVNGTLFVSREIFCWWGIMLWMVQRKYHRLFVLLCNSTSWIKTFKLMLDFNRILSYFGWLLLNWHRLRQCLITELFHWHICTKSSMWYKTSLSSMGTGTA